MIVQRLATFVQMSDLHIGDVDPTRNDGTYDADAPNYWKYFSLCEGLLGHTVAAMEDLEELVSELVDKEEARLLITGDLTCTGKRHQFKMARAFLGGDVSLPSGNVFGLRQRQWKARSIGGNHDQWNGRMPLLRGGISRAYHTLFPPGTFPRMAPDAHVVLSDGQGIRIRFAMVDSDADNRVAWPSMRRILARGKFSNQLTNPAIDMGQRQADEIRTVLIHHSPTHPAISPGLRMHGPCRTALDRYLVEQEVSVVMTGHIHVPKINQFVANHPSTGQTRQVLETRRGCDFFKNASCFSE